ncbi:hypothetical protein FOG18_05860 [Legionella israelensis]|uniref:hypothetical protein n=1 Tax=Legionella israelensis TaxID=454 RepID=UPI00117C2AB4|nr:hypothetical protein [Legionella israelensis]QDP72124.1 hypothetical protein FOG18_05860 [Legionella israelensis]
MEKYIVKLTAEEREKLLLLIKVGKVSANKLMRALVLLAADENNCQKIANTDEKIAKDEYVWLLGLNKLE